MRYWIWRYWHDSAQASAQKVTMLYAWGQCKSNFAPWSIGLNFQWKSTIVFRVQISHLFGSIWFFIFCETLFNMINTHYNLHQILRWLGVLSGRNAPLGWGGKGEAWGWESWLTDWAGYLSTAQRKERKKHNLSQQLIPLENHFEGQGKITQSGEHPLRNRFLTQ